MEKYISTQESFYLQGILNDINEQDTSFLDCKQKHMMKRGAPPDKVRVLYRCNLWSTIVSQAELIFKGYYSFVSNLISFLAMVWVPLRSTMTSISEPLGYTLKYNLFITC